MPKKISRDEELSGRKRVRERLVDLFKEVLKGFEDQCDRSDQIMDFWDLKNSKLGDRQLYNGTAKIFVPITADALKARRTRFTNQIFPRSGRYVEVTTHDETMPHATTALLEHYVRRAKLRTQVVPALVTSGDVEGQYSLYVGWRSRSRRVVSRETSPVKVAGLEMPEFGEVEETKERPAKRGEPYVEVLSDADVLILPVTTDSIDDAIEAGGSVTVVRRWTKAKIKEMIDDGDFTEEAGEALLKRMAAKRDVMGQKDMGKAFAEAAGIKGQGGMKFVVGYETWTKLKVADEMRICRVYFGGKDDILGCKLNPYWCDEVPVLSSPVEKVPGVNKGRSPLTDVIDVQVFANDSINEAADTAHFSAMPIVMTDPAKNPRTGTMVLGLAAVWEADPNSTKFAQFPELWKHGFEIVSACKQQIFQTMGVNPAMIPQSSGAQSKRNQAEIANEQQVDILTTADAVTNIEEGVLTPLIQRFAAYDHQFRDDDLVVRSFGEMGLRAKMERVPPIQLDARWEFRWFGVEAARNAAQIQQQIAGLNVVKGIPPQMYPGYKLNVAPAIVQLMESTFGPRLAPLIFRDMKAELTVPWQQENEMLSQGLDLPVHQGDDDADHIKHHMEALQQGDPTGAVRVHIQRHYQSIQLKTEAFAQQQGGLPGAPGGAGPGVAGTPKPGSQPGQSRMKGPPGMINADRMPAAGAVGMPRKM